MTFGMSTISLGSFVDARDITAMILFVCSDAGAKVSGQALAVDGHTETLARGEKKWPGQKARPKYTGRLHVWET